ncbi:Heparan-alpha-glucosaminide N-acetyltransferase [Halotydeus destructor]|nr:Heparan-alpha-glucosaminide N-acetyltransferase [Halotydeus destructor]
MTKLGLDQVLVTVVNTLTTNVTIWWQTTECYQCPLQLTGVAPGGQNFSFPLDMKWSARVSMKTNKAVICDEPELSLNEGGAYEYWVSERGCHLTTVHDGHFLLGPLCVAILFYLVVWVALVMVKGYLKRSAVKTEAGPPEMLDHGQDDIPAADFSSMEAEVPQSAYHTKKREKSLDTLRGMVITSMIFVNYGAGGYAFLDHAPWYGINFADLVFPTFIFMMGISVSLSMRSQLNNQAKFGLILRKIVIRSLKLFVIGVILQNPSADFSTLRVPGILQRFGISYITVASVHLFTMFRVSAILAPGDRPTKSQLAKIYGPEILVYLVVSTIYIYFTLLFSYEGCPTGYQGPGGISENGVYMNCTGGAAGYLDRKLLGKHLYQRTTCLEVYKTEVYHDPEGLLGCTTSILLTYLGLIVGRTIVKHRNPYRRASRWFIMAATCAVASFILAATGLIPVVKNLWSLSYILATGSFAMSMLLVCYFLTDVSHIWSGRPFVGPGKNAILLYIGHQVLQEYLPFNYNLDHPGHYGLLLKDCIATTIWLLIGCYLDDKKIYFVI